MEPTGLGYDNKFNGELFCVECYSEQEENWGILIIDHEWGYQPMILTERRAAQESLEKIDLLLKEFNSIRKLRICRFIRG